MSESSGTGDSGAMGGATGKRGPVFINNVKRFLKKENMRKQVINTVVQFMDNVIMKPEVWASADLKPIRDQCYLITSDLVKFPPPLQMCDKTTALVSLDDVQLTVGFLKLIYESGLTKVSKNPSTGP
mmetsp:Transcript_5446/g.11252  ORF Transcript_5446/g.11252 Transcript_5446/m.11252 type:complete len:127 (-) Transcript_5446:1097-1477(-)